MRKMMKRMTKMVLVALAAILIAGATSTTTEAACNHKYKVTKIVKATCKRTGYKKYKCKKCGKKKKSTLKKLSHKYKLNQESNILHYLLIWTLQG